MSSLTASPATLRLFVVSILARLPLAMLTIGVLVHVEHATGSFAAAGLAGGALAIAQGAGGPLLGRLVDHRGQTGILVLAALVAGGALAGLAALPADAPAGAFLLLAGVVGFATPPVPACMRTLLPVLVPGGDRLRSAYAIDAAAVELTWISGPPLVLGLGALCGTGAALQVAAGMLAGLTLAFAAAPASRAWRPSAPAADATPGGALRSDGVRTLALVMAGAGLLFGATEVAVAAAADALGSAAAAGPLLGLWGVGGFLGGLAVARAGGGVRTGAGLALLLAALAGAHLALAAVAGSVVTLGMGIVLAGTLIAPTCASVYAMVDGAAPRGSTTEAFAWLATAVAVGTSAGAAAGGAVAEAAGPASAFLLAGGAAGAVALLAGLGARTLTGAVTVAPAS